MEIYPGEIAIRITKIPAGEAPKKIRKAWVGCVLPCEKVVAPEESLTILTKKRDKRKQNQFQVNQIRAIEVLEEKGEVEAVAFWKEHGFPVPNESFIFNMDEARVVSQVRDPGI